MSEENVFDVFSEGNEYIADLKDNNEEELEQKIVDEIDYWMRSPDLPNPQDGLTADQLKVSVKVDSLIEFLIQTKVMEREDFDKFFMINYLGHLRVLRMNIEPQARKMRLMQGVNGRIELPPNIKGV